MMREKIKREDYSFVAVGGGLAGICAAVAAARHGVKTALVHARPVLGGNASSEIRMHICGADDNGHKPELSEGGILHEIMLKNKSRNPNFSYAVWDAVLYETVKAEKNLTVYLNTIMTSVETEGNIIKSIECFQETTEYKIIITGKYFADCTGNGTLGFFAGADFREGSEAKSEFGEPHAPETANGERMGNTLLFKAKDMGEPVKFTPPPFAKQLTEEALKFRTHSKFHTVDASGAADPEAFKRATTGSTTAVDYGYWWIELMGEGEDFVGQYEKLRDDLYAYVWGMWDHIKNGGEHGAENYDLEWVGSIPGMRESRRLVGDYLLTENDIYENRRFPDAVAYGGWPVDIHAPNGLLDFHRLPSEVYSFNGAYTIPWRSYYSKNIKNLTFAGRDISTTRLAFASTRIMGTCAVGGQAVGTAISLCEKYNCAPCEINSHIEELKQLILEDDGYIPGVKNTDNGDFARTAEISASSFVCGFEPQNLVNGVSRAENGKANAWHSDGISENGEWVLFNFEEEKEVSTVQITFDSAFGTPIKITLSDNRRKQQSKYLPEELVREFSVSLIKNGRVVAEKGETDNSQRLSRVIFEKTACDSVKITVNSTHGAKDARLFEVRIK